MACRELLAFFLLLTAGTAEAFCRVWASRGCVHSITHAGRSLALRLAGTCCASHVGALAGLVIFGPFSGRFRQFFSHAYTYTRGRATNWPQPYVLGWVFVQQHRSE